MVEVNLFSFTHIFYDTQDFLLSNIFSKRKEVFSQIMSLILTNVTVSPFGNASIPPVPLPTDKARPKKTLRKANTAISTKLCLGTKSL